MDEVQLVFNHSKMAQYGLSVSSIASGVHTAIEGNRSTYVQSADDKLYYRVRLDPAAVTDSSVLRNLLISNSSGKLVRLGDVAALRTGPGTITAKHLNGVRATTITGNVDEKKVTSRQANMQVQKHFHDFSGRYPGMYLMYGEQNVKRAPPCRVSLSPLLW
jgi:multidrug efflux pump subunit AcrB